MSTRHYPPTASCLVIMGVSASGKTTIGQAVATFFGGRFLDGDDLHAPENVALMAAGKPLTDVERADWLDAVHNAIAAHLGGSDATCLVVACSALCRRYRDRIRRGLSAPIQFVHLAADFATVLDRLEARTQHFMRGRHMLEDQFSILEPLMADELAQGCVEVDASGPAAVIVDQIVQVATAESRAGPEL